MALIVNGCAALANPERNGTIGALRGLANEVEPQAGKEDGRLKKMVTDRDLEIDVLEEITRKNVDRDVARAPP
jgi:hypothetical protein